MKKPVKKKRKSTSRASRLADACDRLRDQISQLQVIFDSGDFDEEAKIKEANEIISNIDYSEIENLRDEVQEWRDNIEEKFSATQKFSDLEECVDGLDSAISELERGDGQISDAIEIEERVDALSSGVDGCDDVSFPGMFG